MAITQDEFRAALSRFASGVTVVTTKDGQGKMHGITVSAFCSVSLEPPLVLICIEKATGSHYAFSESGVFAVNILSEFQGDLSEHFASQLPDKFENVEYTLSPNGIPLLGGTLANLDCRIVNSYEGGDHSIFVGGLEHIEVNEGNPLIHFQGNYRKLDE